MPSQHSATETPPGRNVEYLSPPAAVNMSDGYFQIARTDHFWVHRRFHVLRHLAGDLLLSARQIAEVGCGHGLLQRQIEDGYRRSVTGFDLNEYGLKNNVSRTSRVCCYDIHQKDPQFQKKFDFILLFDVLEHIANEDAFLQAILYHMASEGNLVVSVPAGEWAYSGYDRAAGHVRRYSIHSLRKTTQRNGLRIQRWSYWGLPLLPVLLGRKVLLASKQQDEGATYTSGFDSRTRGLNTVLGYLSSLEPIPQKLMGTSLMAILQTETKRNGNCHE
jgi:hypothetical protein